MTTALIAAPNAHRDGNGRFLKGNPGGPGNPHVKQVAALKAALYESLTAEDIRAVMQRMLAEALAGDVAAARLVLEYSIGKPLAGTTASVVDAELADSIAQEQGFCALSPQEQLAFLHLLEKINAHSEQRP